MSVFTSFSHSHEIYYVSDEKNVLFTDRVVSMNDTESFFVIPRKGDKLYIKEGKDKGILSTLIVAKKIEEGHTNAYFFFYATHFLSYTKHFT